MGFFSSGPDDDPSGAGGWFDSRPAPTKIYLPPTVLPSWPQPKEDDTTESFLATMRAWDFQNVVGLGEAGWKVDKTGDVSINPAYTGLGAANLKGAKVPDSPLDSLMRSVGLNPNKQGEHDKGLNLGNMTANVVIGIAGIALIFFLLRK